MIPFNPNKIQVKLLYRFPEYMIIFIIVGLSKFARLARSVTRNRSTLLQFSSHMPTTKFDNSKPSQIANVGGASIRSMAFIKFIIRFIIR